MKAIWNKKIVADSDETIFVDGYQYFPATSIKKEYFLKSDKDSVCPFKGTASYYDISVDNEINKDGAWYYPNPNDGYEKIKDYVAFWNGVEITK